MARSVTARSGRARSGLAAFVAKRLLAGAGVLLIVSVLVFGLTQALPGDVARQILGQSATPDQVAQLRTELGLDQPVIHQYWQWLTGVLRGDLGTSLLGGQPVLETISTRVVNSLLLMLLAAAIAIPIAFALGVWSAVRHGRAADSVITVVLLVLVAVPQFVIGIVLILALATQGVQLLPPVALLDPGRSFFSQLRAVVLPVLTLVLGSVSYLARTVRATMIEILDTDYITWARLNGVHESRVITRFALRNALAPAVQVVAGGIVFLTGGVVVVETVFSFPGMGSALVEAVKGRDLPVVQALCLFLGAVSVLCYLCADLIGLLVTPRLRTRLGAAL